MLGFKWCILIRVVNIVDFYDDNMIRLLYLVTDGVQQLYKVMVTISIDIRNCLSKETQFLNTGKNCERIIFYIDSMVPTSLKPSGIFYMQNPIQQIDLSGTLYGMIW